MEIIDNVNRLLGDDLRAVVDRGSRVRIAAATFSIFAFEALKEELAGIERLQFIFTAPTFVATNATDKLRKERREFFIPQAKRESSLYGTEFEIRLRNRLTQRAIARECADWIKEKVEFRSNRTGAPMQQFAVIDERAAYLPLNGFTSADLGYERGDAVSNVVTKLDDAPSTATFLNLFDQIWHNADQVADVTSLVHDHIASVYAENSPERIYFLVLYNLFAEFLDEMSEDELPNDRTGYQETAVWKSLYNFQRDAAIGIINKLETYNGCILADSVGLGKTFTALAVIKYYELRNKSVLVLAPKKLAENWTNYNANLTTNIFASDRFNYDVLAHTDLSRTKGESLGLRLDRINWGNYDLVVIDESHNFRNADYAEEKESRYQRLMRQVIREGVKTKVLMLSATPVNNRFNDLKNQLQLAYEGESENLEQRLSLSSTVDKVFRDAQAVFNEWSKLPAEQRTSDAILRMLDFDFFELLDAVTIARSRKHIQAFYDTSAIGAFPKRLPPISLREPLTDLPGVLSFNEIFEQVQLLNLGVYTPLAYVLASRRQKYEDLYNIGDEGSRANLGQFGRERGLKQLMTVNLLKRLESSVEAFRLTLQRIEAAVAKTLNQLDAHDGAVTEVDIDITDIDAEDESEAETLAFGDKIRIDLNDIDVPRWRNDLVHDQLTLNELLGDMRKVTPEHDMKLQRLRQVVIDKAANPINPGNRKVLIFSAFADTAEYLYRELAPEFGEAGLETALITGGGHGAKTTLGTGYDFQQALTLFSPTSKQRHLTMPKETGELDVLIGTDVISEGQNLQDCDYLINYDIHWNPVRIIQRFGRIDRIGSTNAVIQLVNFWPDISLDEYINLKERVENRMVIVDVTSTGDDNVLTQQSNDTAFRREQLRKLQDEVIELEDVRAGVSITDLGLNDFRMDLLAYLKEYGDIASAPKGLHAVVPANREVGLVPGVVFALRNVNAGSTAYLYLDSIEISKGARPRARVELEVQTKGGPIVRQVKRLDVGSNLHDVSGGIEAYKGLFITEIDANRDVIELSNGDIVVAGQLADRDVTEETKRRIQIREVIRAHLDKERQLFPLGVKVLSLFFIDEVAKYRDYERDDTLGEYARVFEEEYAQAVDELLGELALDPAAAAYHEYLKRDDVRQIHQGYFSIDKKTKRQIDPAVASRGDEAGQSTDADAYDLILRHKERLLSLAEPVRFIFSHSALREGWDNPNVFVMGILKKSDNTISRRQEIGRGLRIAVNQHGERMDNPATVHDINELTVVTDESYTDFVAGLQKEIAESLAARPRKATPEYFAGKLLERPDGSGEKVEITLDQAKQLQHWLTVNGFIDYEQHLTDKWHDRANIDMPEMPAGLQEFHYQIAELVDSLHVDVPAPTDGRKPKVIPLNQANFAKKEFQELWSRINHKAVYQVEFDSDELIRKCIQALDQHLVVSPVQYIVEGGVLSTGAEVDDIKSGAAFKASAKETHTSEVSAGSTVKYDLLGEITEKTQLTRRTAAAILKGVQPGTFARYRQNPEQFITQAARLINEQKATVIVEHIAYDTLEDTFDTAIFTENLTKQDFTNAGPKLSKHIYDYVVTDSKVERSFVNDLDLSKEVAVYAKLPRGFFIPTPVGDYNPDWAIAFQEGSVKHVYFVAETKGSLESLQLKGVENAKIECARKFFDALNAKQEGQVKYDVVTDYSDLMTLVTSP